MKNERIAILKMVSEAKITICEADSLLQALKGTHKRARSNQRHIGNWGGKALQSLKPFAETAKKHLYAVKTDSVENLKRLARDQKRILSRTRRGLTREFKQLSQR